MTIADLPKAGTDRFAVPALDGKVGRLMFVGAGCAYIKWEGQKIVRGISKRTGEPFEFTAEIDRGGPVTLALEVVPLEPSQNGRH